MLQTFLMLLCCIVSTSCFSQSGIAGDSSLTPTGIQHAANNSRLPASEVASLHVYPNPAKNKVSIKVKGFEPGMVIVRIIDTKGKVWREDSRLLTNGEEEIQMFLQVKPGIYFISVAEKNKDARKRLIVL
jgi:hypothetical protein